MSRAELEFNTPDPRVMVTFPGYECEGVRPGVTLRIEGLPFAFAKELQRRWNSFHEEGQE
jgi:hypothetical protein